MSASSLRSYIQTHSLTLISLNLLRNEAVRALTGEDSNADFQTTTGSDSNQTTQQEKLFSVFVFY